VVESLDFRPSSQCIFVRVRQSCFLLVKMCLRQVVFEFIRTRSGRCKPNSHGSRLRLLSGPVSMLINLRVSIKYDQGSDRDPGGGWVGSRIHRVA
jgi:hypothetical protein